MVKTTPGKPPTPVQKLLHLADVEGLRVQFTDYPKVSTFFHSCPLPSLHPTLCGGKEESCAQFLLATESVTKL